MSALLQCLQPPPARRAEPTREHVCLDDVPVRHRRPVVQREESMTLTHNGETLKVADWAHRCGISRQALYKRLDRGWTLERALTSGLGARR